MQPGRIGAILGRPSARHLRRLAHDRPYQPCRLHQGDHAGGKIPRSRTASPRPTSRATARAGAITMSWCAAPSPTCASGTSWCRRGRTAAAVEGGLTLFQPSGEQMSIYDAAMRYRAQRHADHRVRRRGIRHRLVAGLGSQRYAAARRPGGHREELRADPPVEPRGHGRAAAPVHGQ